MSEASRKNALITGASRGLGFALAERLTADGWAVVLDAREEESLKEAVGSLPSDADFRAVPGDVSDPAHRERLARGAHGLGGLDLLVNNASTLGQSPLPPLLDYPLDVLEEVYRVNVLAPLALLQAVRHEFKPGAAIVNITSDAAVQPYEGWGGYGSSKAALERVSAGLAAENPALRVYTVDPGDMRTRMHQEAFPGEDISDRPLPEAAVPGILRLIEEETQSGRYSAQQGPPVVRGLRVALTADDFDEAREFYGAALGLPAVEEWSDKGGAGIIFGAGGAATIEILDRRHAGYVNDIETGHATDAGPPASVRLAFEVEDTEATSRRLMEAGASAEGPVVMTPWGDLNRRLIAPGGQQLTLYEVDARGVPLEQE